MTGKPTRNYFLSVVMASIATLTLLTLLIAAALKIRVTGNADKRGGTIMAIYGELIMKSARNGALLAGVAGFFYGTYMMVTSHALGWTDVSDAMETVVVVLVTAAMISSLCIAVGWVAGLVIGIVASPLRSFAASGPRKRVV
jgi:hypothetical protein